jgi:hypothetical protein
VLQSLPNHAIVRITETKPQPKGTTDMPIKTRMETTPCGRCGGSGRYAFNLMDGDKCYGCNGKGVKYTKSASVALDLFRSLREQPLDSFTPGDLVRHRTMGAERTVQLVSEATETKSGSYGKNPDGTTNYDDLTYYHGVTLSWGKPENRKGEQRLFMLDTPPTFGAVVTDELHEHAVELMIEYQNLLTQKGVIRKHSADRATEIENEIREIFSTTANRVHKPVIIPIR